MQCGEHEKVREILKGDKKKQKRNNKMKLKMEGNSKNTKSGVNLRVNSCWYRTWVAMF